MQVSADLRDGLAVRAGRAGLDLSDIVISDRDGALYLSARYARLSGPRLPAEGRPDGFFRWALGRQVEFSAGRVLIAAALSHLGRPETVGYGPLRAPVWPNGASGSLSHAGDRVVALVRRGTWRIGIDVEDTAWGTTLDALRREVLTSAERDALAEAHSDPDLRDTLGFSAKETLFKALFPEVGRIFGFEAARIQTATRTGVTLELTEDLAPNLTKGTRLGIQWRDTETGVETWLVAARNPPALS